MKMKRKMTRMETKNTFSNHIQELRKRIGISFIAIIIAGISTFIFHKEILEFLINPPSGITYK